MSAVDHRRLRDVLGHFPTGVTVITTLRDGVPSGMAANSFVSVSLDPPLIAFCPTRNSATWRDIEATGRFCVNLLQRDQAELCARFATRGADRFGGLDWTLSPGGSPLLPETVGWLDCTVETTFDGGDHLIVLGRVHQLDVVPGAPPLVFFRGRHPTLATSLLSTPTQ